MHQFAGSSDLLKHRKALPRSVSEARVQHGADAPFGVSDLLIERLGGQLHGFLGCVCITAALAHFDRYPFAVNKFDISLALQISRIVKR